MTGEGPSRHTIDAVSRPENADNIDRLTSVADAVNGNESYAFDGVGNRTASHLSHTYTHQPFTSYGDRNVTKDANGNTVSKVEGSKRWTYSWDYENRLTEAWDRKTRVRYSYDALGRRVERNLGFGRERTRFTYDGDDVLLDDANGTQTKYRNGPGIDNKLSLKTGSAVSYFLADHLGSTNGLADSAGTLTATTGYDAFGTRRMRHSNSRNSPRVHSFSGLYYYRARMYDPNLGRFISEDPIGFDGGDFNLYGYVRNNPISRTDPMGLCWPWEWPLYYYYSYRCGKSGITCRNLIENEFNQDPVDWCETNPMQSPSSKIWEDCVATNPDCPLMIFTEACGVSAWLGRGHWEGRNP